MNCPHEQQAAAMARAGELTDGEQLRECVISGQVSAAQVVAHAEAGEFEFSVLRLAGYDPLVRLRDAKAALAAERAEVARLREALERLAEAAADSIATGVNAGHLDSAYDNARAALTAPGEKHE